MRIGSVRFNEAAVFPLRKDLEGVPRVANIHRFNEAAVFPLRKVDNQYEFQANRTRLQ